MDFLVGRPTIVQFSKFDGTPHWHHIGRYLGQDEHGHWVGAQANTPIRRRGDEPVRFVIKIAWVNCFAITDNYVLTSNENRPEFYGEKYGPIKHYVDITSVPKWDELQVGSDFDDLSYRGQTLLRVQAVDLDLDVVERFSGEIAIVDQDEFAENQVRYGYPGELISRCEQTAERIYRQMRNPSAEPFASAAAAGWLAKAKELK